MYRLFREHLQRAHGNALIVVRIFLARIVFGEFRHDDLHVALRPESTRLKQRSPRCHASPVHVETGLDVVQCVGHDVGVKKELVAVDMLCISMDQVLPREKPAVE